MNNNKLTDDVLLETLKLYDELKSQRAVANKLGINKATVSDRLTEAKKRNLSYTAKLDEEILSEEERLKIALNRAYADIRSLKREADTAETIRQTIWGLSSHTPEPPEWIANNVNNTKHTLVPMTVWSDWHYGEVVAYDEVNGLNVFNAKIAKERIELLVEKTIDICENHMGNSNTTYPGIIVCLGGDMISGDIHEELAETNDRTPFQAVNDLVDIIAAALIRVADRFGRVFVPCVVGNHGRDTKKPRMKSRVYTSFEWNLYCSLERYFKDDDRFYFMIPNETDAYFKVFNHKFLLTHGDSLGVKGGDGIIGSIGPIMRGSIKVGNSESQVGRDIDTIIMGHWHQTLWLPSAIVNNSLKGYDEFARLALRAPYSRPSQLLWFVNEKYGITTHWEIFLDDRQKEKNKKKVWLTWPDIKNQ